MESNPQQLAAMDWPWQHENHIAYIILTSDEQFLQIASEPDTPVEQLGVFEHDPISLRDYCRQGAAQGATTLRIAYDYFFGGSGRGMYPDQSEFQDALKKVYDVAAEFGLGIEPSILSPLELGSGYHQQTGESGRWLHYREGIRDPKTGTYSINMWQHQRWCNNKGPTPLTLIGVRAFAFSEERIPNSSFFAVNPNDIVELDPPTIEEIGPTFIPGGNADTSTERHPFKAVQIRAHGSGNVDIGHLDRVMIVLQYATVEMDYFSPTATEFLDDLVQQFMDREINITGLYSDEMHIQQDWSYHSHLENGQFTLRYVSDAFERAFAAKYGEQYADFAKYMLYFASNQHDFLTTHEPKLGSQHVFGTSADDIQATLRMRRDYYQFLEHGVIDLVNNARFKLEEQSNSEMDAYYHATWAESPTVDIWRIGDTADGWSPAEHRRKYEYGPDFLWSNTVHQAAAACADYFSWNEFLTGGNNDTPEGGYADRNYYGRALACSLAELNRRPLASAGMWGMPHEVRERMEAISAAFGAGGHTIFRAVQDYDSRQTDVLFLYPQDLVAVDERFGSWMTQYGYANYITAQKLVEYGSVTSDGLLAVKGTSYRAVCALYEPFPSPKLQDLLQSFVSNGGTIVWSSIPPLAPDDRAWLQDVFGIECENLPDPLGFALPARQIMFENALASVDPMTILTDFTVDRVFPVKPSDGVEVIAQIRTGGAAQYTTVGTCRSYSGGGKAVYLGFRPRDDQAASTGQEVRTWFEILHTLNIYSGSGIFEQNDNPDVLSRELDYMIGKFPNGTITVAPHYRHHEESWAGGFFRNEDDDREFLKANPLADDNMTLANAIIAGQRVTFTGRHAVAWRLVDGRLLSFAGVDCQAIELNETTFTWSDRPVTIAWHFLDTEHSLPGSQALYRIWCDTTGAISFPLNLRDETDLEVWLGSHQPLDTRTQKVNYNRVGYGTRQVNFNVNDGSLLLDVDEDIRGHWLYVIQRDR